MPSWMAARPHLASRLLAWRNAYRYRRSRTLGIAALGLAAAAVAALLPPTGPILGWLGRNWAVAFVIAACGFTLATARRSQRAADAAASSWLASLPVPSPVWMQVAAGTAAWLAAAVGFSALVWLAGAIDRADFSRLVFAVAAGAVFGLLAGGRLPRAGIGAPGFHYAIVRRARARWASAPGLSPLGNWPAAQGRIFSRPKKTAPLVLLAMLAVPMGTPGQAALAAAGVCMALFSVVALSAAAIRAAFQAARWLAPTTVGRWRFTAALIWRVAAIQLVTLAVLIFLASALAAQGAVAVGVPLAGLYLGASLAVTVAAAFAACWRAGLGASARGA